MVKRTTLVEPHSGEIFIAPWPLGKSASPRFALIKTVSAEGAVENGSSDITVVCSWHERLSQISNFSRAFSASRFFTTYLGLADSP